MCKNVIHARDRSCTIEFRRMRWNNGFLNYRRMRWSDGFLNVSLFGFCDSSEQTEIYKQMDCDYCSHKFLGLVVDYIQKITRAVKGSNSCVKPDLEFFFRGSN